ncbi:hypothetical protein J2S00_003329 [Caldalkalibacillus uzonensis]|uniref:TipAS antibiotic-recognition domain-containing protein n=1 Tax=Caldalkalibacillus uzonensis TaxID=353224 RepID=A0ABU0CW04_9BACI|nr:TipAS antibiotic-recognition domain-containing protein [Caldalkalibacillus uzonensis]MDQ0340514.1 hypothetical protein [Caldalkalibacillus uzonensis]
MTLKKREQLDAVLKALDHALHVFEAGEEIDWEVFVALILSIQKEKQHKEWLQRWLDKESVDQLFNISDQEQIKFSKQYVEMMRDFKQSMDKDPGAPEVQELVHRYLQLTNDVIQTDSKAFKQLVDKIEEIKEDEWDKELFFNPYSPELETFMNEAIRIYIENNQPHHGDLTPLPSKKKDDLV